MPLSPQQLAARQYRLGASEIATILGDNPYCTPLELWAEKTNRQIDPESIQAEMGRSQAIELGHMLEPVLLDWAERKYGKKTVRNVEYRAPGDQPVVSTLDAHWEDRSEVLETKTSGLAGFSRDLLSKWDGNEYPMWYHWQVQTQMHCSGIHKARLIALVAGRGILEYEIDYEHEQFIEVLHTCTEWWNYHIGMDVPPQTENQFAGLYRHIKPEAGEEVELDEQSLADVNWIKRAAKVSKRLEEKSDTLKARLMMQMGLATEGKLPDGRLVTFREMSRSGYTVGPKKFRQLNLPRK